MVAPKVASDKAKEKNDEKKPISSSPEPFQEPDGMTTIDLNKSDEYSREIELERAMQKQRAQLRYVTQLIFALGAIFLVVLMTIIFGLANKRYHFFPINQLNESNQTFQPTPSPAEEFVNITRILNQALFREKLESGNYLYSSYDELNLCKTRQTVDTCCSVFKNTGLHGLAEYCTVNDMLNILLEYELNRRKTRQVRDFDEYEEITLHERPLKEPQHSKYPFIGQGFSNPSISELDTIPKTNLKFNEQNFRHVIDIPNVPHQNIQNNLQIPNVHQNIPFPGPPQHQTSEIYNIQAAANGNLNFPENVPVVYHAPNQPVNHQSETLNFNSPPEVPKMEYVHTQPRQNQEFSPAPQQFFGPQPNMPPMNFPQQVAAPFNNVQFINANSGNFGPRNVADQSQNHQQQPINSHIESFAPPTNVNLDRHLTIPQWPNPNQELIPHNINEQPKNPNIEPSSDFKPLPVNLKNPSENQRLIPSYTDNRNYQPNFPHMEILNINRNFEVPQSIPKIDNQQQMFSSEHITPQPNFGLGKNTESRIEVQTVQEIPTSLAEKPINPEVPKKNTALYQNNPQRILPFNEFYDNLFTTEPGILNNEDEGVVIPLSWLKTNNSVDIDPKFEEINVAPQRNQPEIETSPPDPESQKNKFTNQNNHQRILHFNEFYENQFTTEPGFLKNKDEGVVLPLSWLKTNKSADIDPKFEENMARNHPEIQTSPPDPESLKNKFTNQNSAQRILHFNEFYDNLPTTERGVVNNGDEGVVIPLSWLKTNKSADMDPKFEKNMAPQRNHPEIQISPPDPESVKNKITNQNNAQRILHFNEFYENVLTTETGFLNNEDEGVVIPLSWLKTNKSADMDPKFEENMAPQINDPEIQTSPPDPESLRKKFTTNPTSTDTISTTDNNSNLETSVHPTKENQYKANESTSSVPLKPAEKHESPLSILNTRKLEKDKSTDDESTTSTNFTDAIQTFVGLSKPRQNQEKIQAKAKQLDSFTSEEVLKNKFTTNPTITMTNNLEPETLVTEQNNFKTDESTSSIPSTSAEKLGSPSNILETSKLEKGNSADEQPSRSTDPTELIVGLSRSRQTQEEIRAKAKQMDSFTTSEDIQSNQQAFVNPCYYPYMNPYTPFMPAPARVGSVQDPGFLRVVQVTPQKSQNQPMYVLNPALYYGMPSSPSPQPTYPNYPANPYMASGFFPSQPGQSSIASVNSLNSQVQVTSPGGQYFMCNPIPTPTNNIAHLAGVEVRRESSNLQSLMDEIEDVAASNNKSREASIMCPLGEQACLDNSKCIKNYHICDSEVHCDDSSDEIACTCKERVGKLRLCDGYCDCPRCEDEQGCFGCGMDEFSCDDWSRFRRSTCIPLVQKCDGIKQCEVTGKDEMDCSMLADHIGNFPLSKVSNSVGFLHRNYKGKWYPTCFGTELWAAQVCMVEAGPSAMIPKAHMTLTTDPYDGLFINALPNSEVSLVNTCVQDRAAFVECPPIYCGLRFLVNNPYRSEEVDTSIEDMLSDLERAYKMNENGFERTNLESNLERTKNNQQSSIDLDLRSKGKLAHEQLEEVIEDLEKTFTRRDVSGDESIDFILKDTRVVGGKPSQPAAWPWLVSIYKNGIFHCGGVLINELWIVTASHCVDRYWQYYYEVQVGALRRFSYSPMDQRRWVTMVVAHEFYSKTNLRNDIALMKMSAPIRYNRYVRPICLPSETTSGKDYLRGPTAGTICTTVGWGATIEHGADPDHMREVEVPILHHCKHNEDSDTEEICAGLTEGGRDACQGDSGGPLMCRNPNNPNQWYLAGIVSHGEGCARPNEPGVYTRVSRYMGWVAESTRESKVTSTNPLQKCPGYTCKGTKRCVPKKRRCDRIIDCLLGDDEMNCENKFREIFKHSKKSLLPPIDTNAYEDYDEDEDDANLAPSDDDFDILETTKKYNDIREDESIDYLENAPRINTDFEETYFRCKVLLQVIPLAKRCNKIFDCEDGSDESDCTCVDYIRTTDVTAICDGVTDCMDLSDENNCVICNKTEYLCPFSRKCIELTKRCDGTADCPLKDDEIDCVSLTNGQNITLDKDNRPMFKSRGIATINHEGQWKPFCLNKTSQFIGNEAALGTIFCNLLGFDDYLTYHRYRIDDVAINSSYSMISGKVVQNYEPKHCENCCDGLYISCSNTSTSTTLHHESLKEVKELYFSPWMAAIYFNGQYKCMGTILDKLWIVTSLDCVNGLNEFTTNYITAVLGKGKLHITEKGPHEQIIRVTSSININDTDIVLLRLENYVFYNRYVQASDLNVRREGLQKEKCYATGRDNDNKVMFVPLAPLKHCLVGYRCFEKKIEEDCQNTNPWSGTIICDTRMGWYPAAVFTEEKGQCGFSHTKKYTSVKYYKNRVFEAIAMTPEPILPPTCHGFQCILGNCIGEEKICNDINDCHNGEDETATLCYEKEKRCHVEDKCVCSPTDLKCPTTNKCFPKSSFCDRTNNCGEFEDEPDICSCRNYLKLTNPGKICDGTLNCMDRSDEDPEICSCKLGDFQCGKSNKCVPQELVCDEVEDCPNGEDEAACLILKTENREKTNAGEVMTRTAGIWHSGCFNSNFSTTQLEQICTKLGFNGDSANQLTPPHNMTELTSSRPILDSFEVVWLRRQSGNKMKLRIRSGYNPYVTFLPDKDCHRLFIACI